MNRIPQIPLSERLVTLFGIPIDELTIDELRDALHMAHRDLRAARAQRDFHPSTPRRL